MNYNVCLTFCLRITDGLSTGIWASSVLSNFISVTQAENTKVGIAQALQGTFLVATAIPAAWLCSYLRRSTLLKFHSLCAFAAIATLATALTHFTDPTLLDRQFQVMCAGLSLMGMAQASAPIIDSIFADSIATGKRAGLYTWLTVSYVMSSAVGPATAATLFILHGDNWSTEEMSNVMLVGLSLAVVPASLMLLFDDTRTLGQEAEGLLKGTTTHGSDEERGLRERLLPPDDGTQRTDMEEQADYDDGCGRSDDLQGFEHLLQTPTGSHVSSTHVSRASTPALTPSANLNCAYRPPSLVPATPTRSSLQPVLQQEQQLQQQQSQIQQQQSQQQQSQQQPTHPPAPPTPPSSAPPPPVAENTPPHRQTRVKSKRQRQVEGEGGTPHLSGTASPSGSHASSSHSHNSPAAQRTAARLSFAAAANPGQGSPAVRQILSQTLGGNASANSSFSSHRSHTEEGRDGQAGVSSAFDSSPVSNAAAGGASPDATTAAVNPATPTTPSASSAKPAEASTGHRDNSQLTSFAIEGCFSEDYSTPLTLSPSPLGTQQGSHQASMPEGDSHQASLQPPGDSSRHDSEAAAVRPFPPLSPLPEKSVGEGTAGKTDSATLATTRTTGAPADKSVKADTAAPPQAAPAPSKLTAPAAAATTQPAAAPTPTSTAPPLAPFKPAAQAARASAAAAAKAAAAASRAAAAAAAASFKPAAAAGSSGNSNWTFRGGPPASTATLSSTPADKGVAPAAANTHKNTHTNKHTQNTHTNTPCLNGVAPAAAAEKQHSSPAAPLAQQHTPQPTLPTSTAVECKGEVCEGSTVAHTPGATPHQSPIPSSRAQSTPQQQQQALPGTEKAAMGKGGSDQDGGGEENMNNQSLISISQPAPATSFACLTPAAIPYVLALTDGCMGLASGMTIKFMPIFFRTEAKLSPAHLSMMYTAIPLSLSCMALLAQREAKLIGRVQTMATNRLIGILLLLFIASHTGLWMVPTAIVPLYILRTSIMNAQYPIQRSILMDYVPKASRARWASVESVTQFGWSGSAALGGFLIERYGFQTTFLITSSVQSVGWLCSLLLLPLVPRKEVLVLSLQVPNS